LSIFGLNQDDKNDKHRINVFGRHITFVGGLDVCGC
jgi:hypothetical protein